MKTLTMRVYEMIKLAAHRQKCNISNFIEFATLQYLGFSQFVDSEEMPEILDDKELVKSLMDGVEVFKKGDYTIV